MSIDTIKNKILIFSSVVFCIVIIFILFWFFLDKNHIEDVDLTKDDVGVRNEIVITAEDLIDPLPNDKDRDGIDDEKERELGLSEVLSDSDKDGLQDNDELMTWKTDPLKFDTDGDGFGDGWEVLKGYNPNGQGVLLNAESNTENN